MRPKIELIIDKDCPNIKQARQNLMQALVNHKLEPTWQEWDRNDQKTPKYAQLFGSPSILINGNDVAGVQPSPANNCRVYTGIDGSTAGVPPVSLIQKALNKISKSGKKTGILGGIAIGPALGTALLAKAACPLCYPAIGGLLSAVGLGFLFEGPYFIVLSALLFFFCLFGLYFRSNRRRGLRPFFLGLLGTALFFVGHSFIAGVIEYLGFSLVVAASVWNLWPKKNSSQPCDACTDIQSDFERKETNQSGG